MINVYKFLITYPEKSAKTTMQGQKTSPLHGSKRFFGESGDSDDHDDGTPDKFMIVHKASGLVLEVLPTGQVCLSQPHNGLSQMFYRG